VQQISGNPHVLSIPDSRMKLLPSAFLSSFPQSLESHSLLSACMHKTGLLLAARRPFFSSS
jgi:hypothetical protein